MRSMAILFAAALLAGCASPRPALDVDREEGVHAGVQVEWWYHFGWLTDEQGGEWACVSSFFRTSWRGMPPTRYMISDLIDLKTGKSDYRSRVGTEALPALIAATGENRIPPPHEAIPGFPREKGGDPLRLTYGEDLFERTGPRVYRLRVGRIDLELRAASEPIRVEGTGLTGIARPEDMHYYSIPRLEASGTVAGRRARGTFWYDHQWGGSWLDPKVGWSWWGLQLDDGRSVNAYVLRDVTTGRPIRSILTHDRGVEALEAEPLSEWTAPSGIRYPVAWEISGGPFRLRIDPMFQERECAILGEQKFIWEGPVRVSGSHTGRGFQELVGHPREQGSK